MIQNSTTKQKGSLLNVICKYEGVNNILANHDEIINDSVEEHSTNMHNLRRMQDDFKSMLSVLENAEQRLNRRVDAQRFKELANAELEKANQPTRLKTKLDIVLFIATVKGCDEEQLKQLVKEYKNGFFEVV